MSSLPPRLLRRFIDLFGVIACGLALFATSPGAAALICCCARGFSLITRSSVATVLCLSLLTSHLRSIRFARCGARRPKCLEPRRECNRAVAHARLRRCRTQRAAVVPADFARLLRDSLPLPCSRAFRSPRFHFVAVRRALSRKRKTRNARPGLASL